MKALEVSVDGNVIGIFVPPAGESFLAEIGSIPRSYMRAHIMSADEHESWQWQLPDISEGQTISFRRIEAEPGSGVPPHDVRQRNPEEIAELRRLAAEGFARAMKESEAESPSHKR
jgi:hypothetical protein